ncbi:ABC transporter substrate-binding protein [Paracoccus sp. P2]|uniref:ABC transporter substrate-binding protein n=1 Tax=Paracoccus pantotrophus TaxID=82367 RepID=A0A7H9BW14_PARPN|nr:ABC transporter substrate-binding protein [Paracoccus pantotrophus]MDF3855446.1 ABC transporter substrate-binding protein [Paracoccus pantotrophus]QLH15353.1 ABC transporter substrate-binding protein [Paracoccus pantotrophus]RDD97001.1 ABC transporter substrate-binding protein [Paracoccus pantotrophus]RNI20810.1 ABC transporter substrate-binding protein [Paracoccus pantotrophus]WGR65490.1 ABC transporter substrate-binding protein [Paracoccus pantotrophus]
MLNRRRFLTTSTLAAASLAAPGLVTRALAQGEALKIGVPVPISGAFAANGKFATIGALMAAEEVAAAHGVQVSTLDLDTEGKPATAVRKVQDALAQDGVKLFAGGILSSESLAMGKEVERGGGAFMTTAGADEITGVDCNKATFRWSVPTYGAINETVRPIIEALPDAKKWYTITPQYVFGDGLLNAAKDVFAEKGIEHVGNSYHSLTDKEFSGYLTNAIAAQPDVLLLLNFGAQSSDTLRQAVSFGLKQRMTIVVAWASGLEQFEALGPDICEGVYFGAQYWHGADTALNRELVAKVQEKHGFNPNYSFAGSYICAKLLLEAAVKAGSPDGAGVAAALNGLKYQGLTGEEEIRAADHQVIKDYYLLKGKAKADMADKDDYAEVISAGKSFLAPEDAGCTMPA